MAKDKDNKKKEKKAKGQLDPYAEMSGELEEVSIPKTKRKTKEEILENDHTQEEIMSEEDAKAKFNESVEFNTARAVELPTVETQGEMNEDVPQTLRDAINSGSDLTDMQFAAEKLFPSKLGINKVHNAMMVGRNDPNAFLPMLHLNAVDRIMSSLAKDYKKFINVNDVYMEEYTLLSIGLDGEGRIDQLELAGAAREEKRLQNTFGASPLGH